MARSLPARPGIAVGAGGMRGEARLSGPDAKRSPADRHCARFPAYPTDKRLMLGGHSITIDGNTLDTTPQLRWLRNEFPAGRG